MDLLLTNDQVKSGIKSIVVSERENLVLFLRYLIEMEKRELFLEEGASSIHDYCERFLGLSRGTTLKRVWVARVASRFPRVLEFLFEGRLNLTSVSFLARHLTEENHLSLLMGAVGKKESELRWWLSELFPEALPFDWQMTGREKVVPLDGERGKLTLIVDREFMEKLNRAKEIHSHEFPDGNALEILKKALGEDLRRHDPKEKAQRARNKTQAPSSSSSSSENRKESRTIPAGIKSAAAERDNYQCAFVNSYGIRCTEKRGLEFDHIFPWGFGGSSTDLDNIQLLCFAHNRHKGRIDFKTDFRRPREAHP